MRDKGYLFPGLFPQLPVIHIIKSGSISFSINFRLARISYHISNLDPQIWAKNSGWQKIEVPWSQCPRIDPAFIEEERRERGSAWVAQEYEYQFIAARSYQGPAILVEIENAAPAGLNIALGIDLAICREEDGRLHRRGSPGPGYSGNLHVLDVQRILGSFSQQIEFIKHLAAKWKPAVVGIEDVAYQKALMQHLTAQTSLKKF